MTILSRENLPTEHLFHPLVLQRADQRRHETDHGGERQQGYQRHYSCVHPFLHIHLGKRGKTWRNIHCLPLAPRTMMLIGYNVITSLEVRTNILERKDLP